MRCYKGKWLSILVVVNLLMLLLIKERTNLSGIISPKQQKISIRSGPSQPHRHDTPADPVDKVYLENRNNMGESSTARTNILVLSSLGISGSSFLGELVSTITATLHTTCYFYEPLRVNGHIFPLENEAQQDLLDAFHVNISDDFFSKQYSKRTMELCFPEHCHRKNKLTEDVTNARNSCSKQKALVVKTIRTRLAWARRLLDDPRLEIKVIHLVRDPRPVWIKYQKRGWGEHLVCPSLKVDLQEKLLIETRYADRYFFIRYEDLCLDIQGVTRKLMQFIGHGEHVSELPKCLKNYLQEHTTVTKGDAYSLYRNSTDTFQKWRKTINQKTLTMLEQECEQTILGLEYTIFRSVDRVRNISIPVFG